MASKLPPRINLQRGWPTSTLLPADLLLKGTQIVLSDPSIYNTALQYTIDQGPTQLREQLATLLSTFYSQHVTSTFPITASRIAITGGASQSLGIALDSLTDPEYTRAAWLIEPTYFMAYDIVRESGLRVRSVRGNSGDGRGELDLEAFRAQLKAADEEAERNGLTHPVYKPTKKPWPTKFFRHVIYCVPTFANPTGQIMPLSTREGLVHLAREFDALIVTDDVYDFLWWNVSPTVDSNRDVKVSLEDWKAQAPRLVDIDRTLEGGSERPGSDGFGNVISNSSFSKIIGPGTRTGWIECPPKLAWQVSQAGPSRSGGPPSMIVASALAPLLEQGLVQEHIITTLIPEDRKSVV